MLCRSLQMQMIGMRLDLITYHASYRHEITQGKEDSAPATMSQFPGNLYGVGKISEHTLMSSAMPPLSLPPMPSTSSMITSLFLLALPPPLTLELEMAWQVTALLSCASISLLLRVSEAFSSSTCRNRKRSKIVAQNDQVKES